MEALEMQVRCQRNSTCKLKKPKWVAGVEPVLKFEASFHKLAFRPREKLLGEFL